MSILKNKKVLVTGATGFIGSHLVQRLIAEGAHVRAMAHYRSESTLHNLEFLSNDEIQSLDIRRGNVEDPSFVMDCVEGCSIVFHLAALIGIPYSYVAPSSYVATNIQGTLNILEAARKFEVERVLHTSTSECYGSAQYVPINENHPLVGQSPYSATKISADKLAESYYLSFDLPVITVRPFNTYGPRQSGRAIISTIISQLLTEPKQLELGSLDPVRDLTYVADTANGFICAAQAENVFGETINLGVGSGVTIGELAKLIMHITGVDLPIKIDDQRVRPEKSEVLKLISDNSKALAKIGWKPEVTLEQG